MKRMNLIIDENLLKQAKQALGSDTLSETVNRALAEAVRIMALTDLPSFFGSGLWKGDLAEMREDKRKPKSKPSRRRP